MDKFKAVWLSHSSIADFLKCPRLYYLRNVYKDPKTAHKITRMQPALALGQAVHEVVENLSTLPTSDRLIVDLNKRLDVSWEKVSGKMGGFKSHEEEQEYKERGIAMITKIKNNPGPIEKMAIKIKADGGLPYYWLSEDDNIILCGKIDWIEYLPESDTIHILDFKTGRNDEGEESLQLPIYHLLATNTQKRRVDRASYWYLDRDNSPTSVVLPDLVEAYSKVYEVAKRIKLARLINHFVCPKGGCFACTPLERIAAGEGEKVGVSDYGQDIYILND